MSVSKSKRSTKALLLGFLVSIEKYVLKKLGTEGGVVLTGTERWIACRSVLIKVFSGRSLYWHMALAAYMCIFTYPPGVISAMFVTGLVFMTMPFVFVHWHSCYTHKQVSTSDMIRMEGWLLFVSGVQPMASIDLKGFHLIILSLIALGYSCLFFYKWVPDGCVEVQSAVPGPTGMLLSKMTGVVESTLSNPFFKTGFTLNLLFTSSFAFLSVIVCCALMSQGLFWSIFVTLLLLSVALTDAVMQAVCSANPALGKIAVSVGYCCENKSAGLLLVGSAAFFAGANFSLAVKSMNWAGRTSSEEHKVLLEAMGKGKDVDGRNVPLDPKEICAVSHQLCEDSVKPELFSMDSLPEKLLKAASDLADSA